MARKWKTPAVRRTHRWVGAITAFFILFMVLSGIAINHSNGLGLDQRHVSNRFLLSHYGINAPEILSFRLNDDWLSLAGSRLYFNQNAVTEITGGLGAVADKQWIVVAGHKELVLLDHQGELVERLAWQQPGAATVESIGLAANGRVAVRSAGGLWVADEELLGWRPVVDGGEVMQWSSPVPAPAELQRHITRHYQGDGLSAERLLLDMHSGRVFGPLGVLVYDLLALATGFLALSGLVLWLRSRQPGKSR